MTTIEHSVFRIGAIMRLGKGAIGRGDRALGYSPDGRVLGYGTDARIVKLWDVEKKEPIATLMLLPNWSRGICG